MAASQKTPFSIFTALTRDRGTAKEAAVRAIDGLTSPADRTALRELLLRALTTDYAAPARGQVDDLKSSDTRCWLVSALGRIEDQDEACRREVRRHLDQSHEPYHWARYWALEGLIAGRPADLDQLARHLVGPGIEDVPLVLSLAHAWLASRGSAQSLEVVQAGLKKGDAETWATLRALRVVPVLNSTVIQTMCEIISAGTYSDLTFDAIVALGRLPADSQHADHAAQTLQDYLVKYRWPMYEAMRTRALIGLGNLRVSRIAAVLIEELSDDSPGIVSAASRSLQSVLGVRIATARILEAALEVDNDAQARLAGALRYMDRDAVVKELESTMLTGTEAQQAAARNLMSEVGGAEAFQRLKARSNAVAQYVDALKDAEDKIRTLFQDSIVEARQGFRIASLMDIVVFGVGILLVVWSAVAVLASGQALDTWAVGVSGGTGVLAVLYSLLIANPRKQVRDNVDHLMNLKVIFLAYLRQLHQADQAYTRRLLDDRDFPASEAAGYTDLVGRTMMTALAQLSPQVKPSVAEKPAAGLPRVEAEAMNPAEAG